MNHQTRLIYASLGVFGLVRFVDLGTTWFLLRVLGSVESESSTVTRMLMQAYGMIFGLVYAEIVGPLAFLGFVYASYLFSRKFMPNQFPESVWLALPIQVFASLIMLVPTNIYWTVKITQGTTVKPIPQMDSISLNAAIVSEISSYLFLAFFLSALSLMLVNLLMTKKSEQPMERCDSCGERYKNWTKHEKQCSSQKEVGQVME